MTEEFYKVGEKKIPIDQVQRAVSVFPGGKPRRGRKRKRRYRLRPEPVPSENKLHKLADWYRTQEQS